MRGHIVMILVLAGLAPAPARAQAPGGPSASSAPVWAPPASEQALFADAARTALAYLQAHRAPETGLVNATQGWANITLWDIGSLIGAIYAAGELKLLPTAERDAWMGSVLATLGRAPLFDGAAFNRVYTVADARMVGEGDRPSEHGTGWSSTDLGRLLVWLKIVERELPAHAEAVRAVVERIDVSRVVRDGYLWGTDRKADGTIVTYEEGRVGYEQYAAMGFELWGHRAERSLDLMAHTQPVEVLGHTLRADVRGGEVLTSEPFVLMGLELGWEEPFRELAAALLAVQEARFRQTGTLTMVSEDAVQVAPWYFYYYSVFSDGEPFVVRAHGPVRGGPRWMSAKAAFGWHALLPGDYTWRVVEAVQGARHADGWASGVFEGGGGSTGVRNVNTAAVILEAALYRDRGRPVLAGG